MDNNQNPTVYNAPQPKTPSKESWFKPKYILFFLLGVVIVEVIIGVKTFLTPVPVQKPSATPAPLQEASLSLRSPKKDYKVGENVLASVFLSTGGHSTIGTDVVVKYDPKFLEASSSAFTQGITYDSYPLISVDKVAGTIRASGIVTAKNVVFMSDGPFGRVAFKAKQPGKTIVQLVFKKGDTADSNVTEAGTAKDILGKVENLEINIQ